MYPQASTINQNQDKLLETCSVCNDDNKQEVLVNCLAKNCETFMHPTCLEKDKSLKEI